MRVRTRGAAWMLSRPSRPVERERERVREGNNPHHSPGERKRETYAPAETHMHAMPCHAMPCHAMPRVLTLAGILRAGGSTACTFTVGACRCDVPKSPTAALKLRARSIMTLSFSVLQTLDRTEESFFRPRTCRVRQVAAELLH